MYQTYINNYNLSLVIPLFSLLIFPISLNQASLALPNNSDTMSLPRVQVASQSEELSPSDNQFVYSSPSLMLSVPGKFDSSCTGLALSELVKKSPDLCYSVQINELLKHPENASEEQKLLKQPLPNAFFDNDLPDYFDRKYLPKFVHISHEQQLNNLFANISLADRNNTKCDFNLWNNIINPGPPRFYMINPCVTITGSITLIHYPSDGDTVLAVTLDKKYENMVTDANFNTKMNGGIWVELICQRPNTSIELIHKGDCYEGNIPKFSKFEVGDRVEVTGAYIIDIREGGHAEIHPASTILKIS
jgi:hypothetical protein